MSELRGYKLAAAEGAECGEGFGRIGAGSFVFFVFWGASPQPGIIEGLSLFLFSQTGSAIHTVNGDSSDVLHTHQEAVRFGV